MEMGGTEQFVEKAGDFSKGFDPSNEQLCYEYLIGALEANY